MDPRTKQKDIEAPEYVSCYVREEELDCGEIINVLSPLVQQQDPFLLKHPYQDFSVNLLL